MVGVGAEVGVGAGAGAGGLRTFLDDLPSPRGVRAASLGDEAEEELAIFATGVGT